MSGEHGVARRIPGDIVLDERLVVPPGEVACESQAPVVRDDEPDECELAGAGRQEPQLAGAQEPGKGRARFGYRGGHAEGLQGLSGALSLPIAFAHVLPNWKSARYSGS